MADEAKIEGQESVPGGDALTYEAYQNSILAEDKPLVLDEDMADEKGAAQVEPAFALEEGVPKQEEKVVPLAALHEERQRRQKQDAELQQQRELNLRLLEMLSNPAPEPVEQLQRDPLDYVTYADLQALKAEQAKETLPTFKALIEIKEDMERIKHADYDQVVDDAFKGLVKTTPWLSQRIFQTANPAQEAYKAARELKMLTQNNNNAVPPPAPEGDIDLRLQAQKVANQQRQPATAGAGANAAPANPLGIEALLALPNDQFSQVINSLTEAQKRKLFSGG